MTTRRSCGSAWTYWLNRLFRHPTRNGLTAFSDKVVQFPVTTIAICTIVSVILFAIGSSTNISVNVDLDQVWTPVDSTPAIHRNWIENESDFPVQERVVLLVFHHYGQNVLSKDSVEQIFRVINAVTALPDYDAVCAESDTLDGPNGEPFCDIRGVLNFWNTSYLQFHETVSTDEDAIEIMSAKTFPNLLPVPENLVFGHLQRDNETTLLASVESYTISMHLPETRNAEEMEADLLDLVLDIDRQWQQDDSTNLRVVINAPRSFPDEGLRAVSNDMFLIPYVFIIMSVFTCLVFAENDKVESRSLLGLSAVVGVMLSLLASYGLLFWIGVPMTALTQVLPFIIFGVGLDDAFIIMGAYRRTDENAPVEQRLHETMNEIGLSILMTSLTSAIAFALGALSSIPAAQYMALYAFPAVMLNLLYQIIFFVPCIVLDERRIQQRRRDCCFCIHTTPKQVEDTEEESSKEDSGDGDSVDFKEQESGKGDDCYDASVDSHRSWSQEKLLISHDLSLSVHSETEPALPQTEDPTIPLEKRELSHTRSSPTTPITTPRFERVEDSPVSPPTPTSQLLSSFLSTRSTETPQQTKESSPLLTAQQKDAKRPPALTIPVDPGGELEQRLSLDSGGSSVSFPNNRFSFGSADASVDNPDMPPNSPCCGWLAMSPTHEENSRPLPLPAAVSARIELMRSDVSEPALIERIRSTNEPTNFAETLNCSRRGSLLGFMFGDANSFSASPAQVETCPQEETAKQASSPTQQASSPTQQASSTSLAILSSSGTIDEVNIPGVPSGQLIAHQDTVDVPPMFGEEENPHKEVCVNGGSARAGYTSDSCDRNTEAKDSTPGPHIADRWMVWYAGQLLRPWVQAVVLVGFTVFFYISSISAGKLAQEFKFTDLVPADSYLIEYSNVVADHTSRQSITMGVYFRFVDQSNVSMHRQMDDYLHALVNISAIDEPPEYCWLWHFREFVEAFEQLKDLSFQEQLDIFLAQDAIYQVYNGDIARNNDGVITASRCHIGLSNIDFEDINDQIGALSDVYAVTEAQPINSGKDEWSFFSYVEFFDAWQFYSVVNNQLAQVTFLGVTSVTGIAMIFIPHWSAALFVFPLICVLYVDLLGVMQWAGIAINATSFVALSMSIGLLVDYIMHVLSSYYETPGSRRERAAKILSTMGASILLGGISTFIGTLPLAFSTSEVMRTIFILFVALVLIGLSAGLVFLPVVLSIIGPEDYVAAPIPTSGSVFMKTSKRSEPERNII